MTNGRKNEMEKEIEEELERNNISDENDSVSESVNEIQNINDINSEIEGTIETISNLPNINLNISMNHIENINDIQDIHHIQQSLNEFNNLTEMQMENILYTTVQRHNHNHNNLNNLNTQNISIYSMLIPPNESQQQQLQHNFHYYPRLNKQIPNHFPFSQQPSLSSSPPNLSIHHSNHTTNNEISQQNPQIVHNPRTLNAQQIQTLPNSFIHSSNNFHPIFPNHLVITHSIPHPITGTVDSEPLINENIKTRKSRWRPSQQQKTILENAWKQNPYPDQTTKLQLAKQLGENITYKQITSWFKHKREVLLIFYFKSFLFF